MLRPHALLRERREGGRAREPAGGLAQGLDLADRLQHHLQAGVAQQSETGVHTMDRVCN